MNHHRHLMLVRSMEDLLQFLDVHRVVQVHIRIAKVQLQPVVQLRVPGASLNFSYRIILERIDAAKTP